MLIITVSMLVVSIILLVWVSIQQGKRIATLREVLESHILMELHTKAAKEWVKNQIRTRW